MKYWIGICSVAALLFVGTFLSTSSLALAQQQAGVSLSPTLIEKGAEPGEILNEVINITNLSGDEKTYYFFTRDISGVRGAGTPIFADANSERTGYELTEWITIEQTEVTLVPGEEATIPITITVPDNATPGSHFGGIFVSLEAPRFRQVGAGVGFEVANIVSIRIAGDALETAQIRTFSTDKLIYGATNVNFDARIENKGNVLIRHYGPLEIVNMFGETVANMTFNESLGGVFPGTIRDFDMTWQEDSPGFGRYVARLSLVYGDSTSGQKSITSTVAFWILPMNIIGPALIVLSVLLLVTYVAIKLYIRNRVQTLAQGRRMIRRQGRRGGNSTLTVVLIAMLSVTALFLLILLLLFA